MQSCVILSQANTFILQQSLRGILQRTLLLHCWVQIWTLWEPCVQRQLGGVAGSAIHSLAMMLQARLPKDAQMES